MLLKQNFIGLKLLSSLPLDDDDVGQHTRYSVFRIFEETSLQVREFVKVGIIL